MINVLYILMTLYSFSYDI